jgi:GH24 family phage-related lysozyme (muramidase)
VSRPLEPINADFLHGREGLRLQAYDDKDGAPLVRDMASGRWLRPDGQECIRYPTIGWGQRIWSPKYYGPCTRAQADQWFDETCGDFCATVDRYVPDASVHQRGAFVSFAYNAGSGGLINSGLMQLHNTGASADEMKAKWLVSYIKSAGKIEEGLRVRRAKEFAWYSWITPEETTDPGTPRAIELSTEEILARVDATARQIVAEFV